MTWVNKILSVLSVHVAIIGQISVAEDVHNNTAFVTANFLETILCGKGAEDFLSFHSSFILWFAWRAAQQICTERYSPFVSCVNIGERNAALCLWEWLKSTVQLRALWQCSLVLQSLSTSHAEDAVMGSRLLTYCKDSGILQSPAKNASVTGAVSTDCWQQQAETEGGNWAVLPADW